MNKQYFTKQGDEIIGWYAKGKPIVADSRIAKIFRNSDRELYSDKTKMKRNIDTFLKQTSLTKNHVVMAEKLPPILIEHNFDDSLALVIKQDKLRNIMLPEKSKGKYVNTHNIDANDIKDITTMMNFPKYVIKTNDGLIIVTKMNDYKQRPIIVAIKENGDAWKDNVRYKAHVITSIYGRKNFLNWIKKQNIVWRE